MFIHPSIRTFIYPSIQRLKEFSSTHGST